MALTKKQTAYIVGGIAIVGGLYFAKRQILGAVGAAQNSNNAAIAQHQQNAAKLTAAQTLGDATTPTPPVALVATGVNLTEIGTIVTTVTGTLSAMVTLILGYLALEEKRRTLYSKKADG